ncbi:MAG TPA: cyclic nucleotide-binding domain-containing protein [Acidimicrobiales bacterium]|nr:cyclic nucleotide-binding domain-containing protein [Acidimicrobiales bacterium]
MARKKDYLEHLARVPMFSACSKKELEMIARQAEELDVPAGETLIKQGASGRDFFVVVEGKAAVTRDGKDVGTVGAGNFFGELALLDKSPRNATVTASTAMRVFVLTQPSFHGLLATIPSLSNKVMVGMARRLQEFDSRS